MRSILSIVQKLNTIAGRQNEYTAFQIIDENIQRLYHRIEKLEAKNMKYFCTIESAVTQAIPVGAAGLNIAFEKTIYPQFGNMHDNTNNNTKIFIKRDGVYHIAAGVYLEGDAAVGTYRIVRIVVTRNGAPIYINIGLIPALAAPFAFTLARSYYLYNEDTVGVNIIHDGAASLDCIADITHSTPYLSVSERMEDLSPEKYGLLDPDANMR